MTCNGHDYCFAVLAQFYNFEFWLQAKRFKNPHTREFRLCSRKWRFDVKVYVIYGVIVENWLKAVTMISISRANAQIKLLFLFLFWYIIVTCSLTYGNKLCKFLSRNSLTQNVWLDGGPSAVDFDYRNGFFFYFSMHGEFVAEINFSQWFWISDDLHLEF